MIEIVIEQEEPKKEVPPVTIDLSEFNAKKEKPANPDSILNKIETGFDNKNQAYVECKKPQLKTHLSKENYLSEFKTESEKNLARINLGVYSKEEINKALDKIVKENITKSDVQEMISDLDFVNSTMKSSVDYQIPNNLFTL